LQASYFLLGSGLRAEHLETIVSNPTPAFVASGYDAFQPEPRHFE